MTDDLTMRRVRSILTDAAHEAYGPGLADRGVYDFAEGAPSVYDLVECDFRGEDLPLLVLAAEAAAGERREMLDQLIQAMRREGI